MEPSTTPASSVSRWYGGRSPWGMSWQKLMMWWFIVTDALLFAGFLAGYGFSRAGSDAWPDAAEVFSIPFVTAMTFVLITSSAFMACAVAAAKAGDRDKLMRYLVLTLGGGATFLLMQAVEWATVIGHDMTLTHVPGEGLDPAFASYFFLITGFHGTHVAIGLVVLVATLLNAIGHKSTENGVEVAGLYWHFVDLVWVFVFGCFYLL